MHKVFFLFPLLLFLTSFSVDKLEINFKNAKDAKNRFNRAATFYNFQKHETVVSIGAEDCENEIIYGMMYDSVNFILENISSTVLSIHQLSEINNFYESKFHRKNNSKYKLQYGNDTSTLLPSNSIDKVIIENTFHEFSKPAQMLHEIHRILKPNGTLCLNEMLASKKNKMHSGCKQKLITENQLQQLCAENQFTIIRIEIGSKEFRKDFNKLIEIKKIPN